LKINFWKTQRWWKVCTAQGKRHPNSRTRGRTQTPAEVALRLLILKYV